MEIKMQVADLQAFLARDFPQVTNAFTVQGVTNDGIVAVLTPTEADLRPGGTVSGPAMFALADVAAYLAILSRIGPVALAVTTNCSIDFMRKPKAGVPIEARARILKLGRSLAVVDLLIYSNGIAEPVARATMTYAIPSK